MLAAVVAFTFSLLAEEMNILVRTGRHPTTPNNFAKDDATTTTADDVANTRHTHI